VVINTDASLYATILEAGESLEYEVRPDRYSWVQVARGEILVNGQTLKEGDGLAVASSEKLTLVGEKKADVLLFDLA
jgi:redox-sensitive bicupin YhaK (pirin superfamily)